MTTIAYDGRYIAIDSRITSHETHIVSDEREKFVDNPDWMIFWCGDTSEKDIFIEAFLLKKNLDKNLNIGLYAYDKKTKKVYEVGSDGKRIFSNELFEINTCGSGADHALTAMDCGKNAAEAVMMAAKRCACTGGIIRCFDTETGKFIKVNQ